MTLMRTPPGSSGGPFAAFRKPRKGGFQDLTIFPLQRKIKGIRICEEVKVYANRYPGQNEHHVDIKRLRRPAHAESEL
jgi:hypothetical protein